MASQMFQLQNTAVQGWLARLLASEAREGSVFIVQSQIEGNKETTGEKEHKRVKAARKQGSFFDCNLVQFQT